MPDLHRAYMTYRDAAQPLRPSVAGIARSAPGDPLPGWTFAIGGIQTIRQEGLLVDISGGRAMTAT